LIHNNYCNIILLLVPQLLYWSLEPQQLQMSKLFAYSHKKQLQK